MKKMLVDFVCLFLFFCPSGYKCFISLFINICCCVTEEVKRLCTSHLNSVFFLDWHMKRSWCKRRSHQLQLAMSWIQYHALRLYFWQHPYWTTVHVNMLRAHLENPEWSLRQVCSVVPFHFDDYVWWRVWAYPLLLPLLVRDASRLSILLPLPRLPPRPLPIPLHPYHLYSRSFLGGLLLLLSNNLLTNIYTKLKSR